MGIVKRVILNDHVPTPQFNNRLTVELCENVHLHYRNLRLEFRPSEFLTLLRELKTLNEEDIATFFYNHQNFKTLIVKEILPDETYFNNRLQVEEQANGTFHVHYRNLRIELQELSELGITKD